MVGRGGGEIHVPDPCPHLPESAARSGVDEKVRPPLPSQLLHGEEGREGRGDGPDVVDAGPILLAIHRVLAGGDHGDGAPLVLAPVGDEGGGLWEEAGLWGQAQALHEGTGLVLHGDGEDDVLDLLRHG